MPIPLVLLSGMYVPFFLSGIISLRQLQASPTFSAYILLVPNFAQAFGRIAACWWSDYSHRITGAEFWQVASVAGMAVLAFASPALRDVGGYVVWFVVYGFLSGAAITLPAIILPHVCPDRAVYGMRLGMLYGCSGLGFLISSPVGGALISASSGSLLGPEMWTGATLVVAAIFSAITAIEARRQRLRYELGKR